MKYVPNFLFFVDAADREVLGVVRGEGVADALESWNAGRYDDEPAGIRARRIPTCFDVCEHCRGTGKSSAYLGAFTADEFDEQFDPDEQDAYFRGDYDRTCPECNGQRVVSVTDYDALTPADQRALMMYEEGIAESRAIEAAERRMGC